MHERGVGGLHSAGVVEAVSGLLSGGRGREIERPSKRCHEGGRWVAAVSHASLVLTCSIAEGREVVEWLLRVMQLHVLLAVHLRLNDMLLVGLHRQVVVRVVRLH